MKKMGFLLGLITVLNLIFLFDKAPTHDEDKYGAIKERCESPYFVIYYMQIGE